MSARTMLERLKQKLDSILTDAASIEDVQLVHQLEEVLANLKSQQNTPSVSGEHSDDSEADRVELVLQMIQEILHTGKLKQELPEYLMHYESLHQVLGMLKVLQQFTISISEGELEQILPIKGIMAGGLKALQANLRHLTWQTQQVAKGDLSQRIDFMGEFSEAFNEMVMALAQAKAEVAQQQEALQQAKMQVEQRVHKLRAVSEIGQRLTSGIRLKRDEILELIYEQASLLMDTDNMYIALYDTERQLLSFPLVSKDGTLLDKETLPPPRQLELEDETKGGLTEVVLRIKQPIRISDVSVWCKEHNVILPLPPIPKSWIGVPMIIEDNVEGIIALWNVNVEDLYGQDDLEVLQAMVAQAAVAIDNASLYNMAAERAKELTVINERLQKEIEGHKRAEEQLRLAKIAAESANKAKSAFLATMSHEIRTPINAVIGMTTLLLDTRLTSQQRDFAETIRNSGDALLMVINDILDFSKIEAGKFELECYPFNLRECMESALELVAMEAAEKGLDLACLIEAHSPTAIVGDLTRLRQVLLNLLSNAVKFTHQGEVVVNVTCKQVSEDFTQPASHHPERSRWAHPEYELHFEVKDTGIGIPQDRMGYLFDSFSQVDTSTTRKYGGTGLGLAISKRLIEMMSGTMWVESEVGKGSTFHFTIRTQVAESTPPAYLSSEQPSLRGKRVVVVDDNATNRRILTLQTQSWGMEAVAVASGAEALELICQDEPFDVAILDMHMPEMDGLTLAEEIRRYRDKNTLPLVMLTSLGQREKDERMNEFAVFLSKPIKASQLYNILAEVFSGEAGAWTQRVQKQGEAEPKFDVCMGERLPLRILIAEDHPTNQKLALLLLDRLGYQADVAANGLEVLDSLRRQPYNVVLMDVQMPEMDGLEATRTICREWPPDQRPHIIAVTADAMKEDRESCLAAGMDDYISKPIRLEELINALNRCHPYSLPIEPEPSLPEAESSTENPKELSAPPEIAPLLGEGLAPEALQNLRATFGEDLSSVLPELIGSFLDSAPKLLSELQQAMQQGNVAEIGRKAHTLKSSSAVLGASTFSALCRELEKIAKTGILGGTADRIAQIEAEYENVKSELNCLK